MKQPIISNSYRNYKKDAKRIIFFDLNEEIFEEICHLSWNVSFKSKKERIKEILSFIEQKKLNIISTETLQLNTLELILSLSHFRRAKYN